VLLHQTQVMKHRPDVKLLAVVSQPFALPGQRAPQKHTARVIEQQVIFLLADLLGGGAGQRAVGDFDTGD